MQYLTRRKPLKSLLGPILSEIEAYLRYTTTHLKGRDKYRADLRLRPHH